MTTSISRWKGPLGRSLSLAGALAFGVVAWLLGPVSGSADTAGPESGESAQADTAQSAGADAVHRTWAERLGYPAGTRVLILHADDIGMCWEANEAAKHYLENDEIQSAAVMVPCPWFESFASWARKHPEKDVGLHLTLTSEWKLYRWPPVSPRSEVPGLVDREGYLFRDVVSVATSASAEEVAKEIRAQLALALARGLKPGHIDTHMGTLYARVDYTKAYLELAMEHEIPAMAIELTPPLVERFRAQGYPITDESIALAKRYTLPKLDDFHSIEGGKSYEEFREVFYALVRGLDPGITEIIFHPSVDSVGLRQITGSWRQRSWEARLFSDPEVKGFFAEEGLLFTNWREMMRRWRAGKAATSAAPGE